jgi:hypothetical protein
MPELACGIQLEDVDRAVVAMDSKGGQVAVLFRGSGLGSADLVRCFDAKGRDLDDGWALDADTLIYSTVPWTARMRERAKGGGTAALRGTLAPLARAVNQGAAAWAILDMGPVPEAVRELAPPLFPVSHGTMTLSVGDEAKLVVEVTPSREEDLDDWRGVVEMRLSEQLTWVFPDDARTMMSVGSDGAVVRGEVRVDRGRAAVSGPGLDSLYRVYESRDEVDQFHALFDLVGMHFQEETTHHWDGITPPEAHPRPPHRCPDDGRPVGVVGPMPPLDVDCAKGPRGRCVPAVDPIRPWEHPIARWEDDRTWSEMGFGPGPLRFHYRYRWANTTTGYGDCRFTVQAFGDLDGDGVFSTFERVGHAGIDGVEPVGDLRAIDPIE